jgi:hypothetical protein
LLEQIELLEERTESDVPEWVKTLRDPPSKVHFAPESHLDALSEREREASLPDGLRFRLLKLARSGRVSETEYDDLRRCILACSAQPDLPLLPRLD